MSYETNQTCQIIEIPNPKTSYGILINGGIDKPPCYPNLPKGIYIIHVKKDSPAEKAGLKERDQILNINGYDLSYATYKQAVKKFKKDRQVLKLMVSREQIRSEEISGPTLVEFDENGEIVKKQDESGVALETDFL